MANDTPRLKKATNRLNVRYLDDEVLITSNDAWTWMRLPGVNYEFLSPEARVSLADRIVIGLSGLLTGTTESVECHLIVTSRVLDVAGWVDALNGRVQRWGAPHPGWYGYVSAMANHLAGSDYQTKEVYLGVRLGARSKFSLDSLDLRVLLKNLMASSQKAMLLEDHEIPRKELDDWHEKAGEIRRALEGSHLRAEPVDSQTVAWLISKPLWPGIPTPAPMIVKKQAWGHGDLETLVEGVVENAHRHLVITQTDAYTGTDVTGYTATLCASRFPDVLHFPEQEPWIHHASALNFPTDWSIRFTLVPPVKVVKDVSRKLADARDQAMHVAEGGMGVPLHVQEQLNTATALEYTIKKNRTPWVYARYRLRVSAPTLEELRDRIKRIRDHYRDLSIEIVAPSGDQFDLLLESIPGEKVRCRAYQQRQEVPVIAGGMPTASSEVGDRIDGGKGWIGPFLGDNTSRMRLPVFFSPHVAIARNESPGVAIVGAPGGGKALAVDTPIPTPDGGYTEMGHLEPGDKVLDARGNPCTVTATFPIQVGRPCFKVTACDGSSVVADGDHLWSVDIRAGQVPVIASTDDLRKEVPAGLTAGRCGGAAGCSPVTLTSWDGSQPVRRHIVAIDPVASVPVRCIQVDSPDSLFLAGRGQLPTHNSFSAFTLAYQLAAQGVWTIYIDPKADAKPIGLLPGLGSPRVFDLREGHDGMLDPFAVGEDPNQAKLLALETLRLLLGGTNMSEERETAVIQAIEAVSLEAQPSLSRVVDWMLASDDLAAKNLGSVLNTLRELPFARLCFSPSGGDMMRPEDGLTIVTLLGLELPSAIMAPENYSYEARLGVAVMYLLTRYARRLMLSLNKSHPKAIFIDEAWAITGTPQGARLIPETARMGRSHNTALILVSQNARDLMDEQITNSISTVLAFKSKDPKEVDSVLSLLGVPIDDGTRGAIRDLFNGECIMRDVDGRVSRVQISAWNPVLFDAFNTNPETRGKATFSSGV